MTFVLDPDCFDLGRPRAVCRRIGCALRYAGVLSVWFGLLLIRPRLALQIFRERRADSPLRRQGLSHRA